MKFSAEINRHLNGEAFSAGLDIPFGNERYTDISRIEKLIELTRNKRVIHIGCADHLPLIPEKIKNNNWLHGLLCKNASQCIGIDINSTAIDFIKNELGFEDVYNLDILSDDCPAIDNVSKWDYMILGEIIEHVDNPIAFMTQIQAKYRDKVDKIIVTAPNVYNLLTIKDIRKNIENINTDHRYWFSPFTLTKAMLRSGFQDCELIFTERVKLPLFYAAYRRISLLLGFLPTFKANCFSTMLIIAEFPETTI